MRNRRDLARVLFVALATLVIPATARSQASLEQEPDIGIAPAPTPQPSWIQLQPGTRVRIWLPGGSTVEGRLLTLDDRTLTLLSDANQNLSLSPESVAKFEVLKSRKGHWLAGALVGAIAGAAMGAVEEPGCTGGDCYTRAENVVYSSIGAGLVGALVGALSVTDQWAEIPLTRPAQSKVAAHKGAAITLVLRF
jgi:small nuclear ribonucleoprotein (snRNP)-like protein